MIPQRNISLTSNTQMAFEKYLIPYIPALQPQ
jgi:hypothetical protein